MFLMIQNPGIAPHEAFTVLGLSTTRSAHSERVKDDDNDLDLLIGTFGSGSKHAINLLLRNSLSPIVFCGKQRLEFYVKPESVDDGLQVRNYGQVRVKRSGKTAEGVSINRDEKLGFALEYGVQDWDDLSMGLREFVSNAIDRTIREEGKFLPAIQDGRLQIEIVADNQVRAKDGYTRVFVPFNELIQKFYMELPKRFLHFSEPQLIRQNILTKRDRNFGHVKNAVIYRKGVFVREVLSCKNASLFDYNFNDELKMDEARNVDDWRVAEAAAVAMRNATTDTLTTVYRSLIKKEESWESTFDQWTLSIERIHDAEKRSAAKARWTEAWNIAADKAVLVEHYESGTNNLEEKITRKGFKTASVKSWATASVTNGPRTVYDVLSSHETKGLEVIEPTEFATQAVDTVWGWIEECNLTNGREKPSVQSFNQLPDAESETFGFYENGVVFINTIHSNAGVNDRLLQTALDELTHHCTGSFDSSRDFQSFLMRIIIAKFSGTPRTKPEVNVVSEENLFDDI